MLVFKSLHLLHYEEGFHKYCYLILFQVLSNDNVFGLHKNSYLLCHLSPNKVGEQNLNVHIFTNNVTLHSSDRIKHSKHTFA